LGCCYLEAQAAQAGQLKQLNVAIKGMHNINTIAGSLHVASNISLYP
jgi:hypothetical protein